MRESAVTPAICLKGLRMEYPDGTTAVDHFDLDVAPGELLVLVGPSGCGKSTTLRMINRLIEPTSGSITINGKDALAIDPVSLRREIGYVIQDVGLFPHRTVSANVATVLTLLKWDKQAIGERVHELLDLVGLDPQVYAKRYPSALSGGQRQRVGVARALAARPPVLLMDEPFGAVDPIGRHHLQQEFLRIQHELQPAVIFVTHDIDEAVTLGDRVAVLSEGAHLEQLADPITLLASPATRFVKDFIGEGRAVRLLALTHLQPEDLEPTGFCDDHPGIALNMPLSDVLTELISSKNDCLPVMHDGQCVGWATSRSIHQALRRVHMTVLQDQAGAAGSDDVDFSSSGGGNWQNHSTM